MFFFPLSNSTTMNLMSSGPISKSISGKFNKKYESLRYAAPRPIPSNDDLDLTKEEDFLHPEEPKPQEYLAGKVISQFGNACIASQSNANLFLGHRYVEPFDWFDWIICSR